MAEKSSELAAHVNQSQEKFDYFVCGVAGTLFAYVAEHYTPQPLTLKLGHIGFNIVHVSLIFLAVSFLCGLKRIEWVNTSKVAHVDILDAEERADAAAESAEAKHFTSAVGNFLHSQALLSKHVGHIRQRDELATFYNYAQQKAAEYYRIRNWLLVLGFLMIFISKILLVGDQHP